MDPLDVVGISPSRLGGEEASVENAFVRFP